MMTEPSAKGELRMDQEAVDQVARVLLSVDHGNGFRWSLDTYLTDKTLRDGVWEAVNRLGR